MSKGKFDVKSVLAWAKSRWSLVAFAVIAVLLVPAMVYFAMGMANAKHAEFQDQVKKDSEDFRVTVVKYKVPGLFASDPGIEWASAANEESTKRFKEALDRQQASAGGVVAEAVNHNKGTRKPLLDHVFPQVPENDLTLAKQFRRVYVNDSVKTLLDLINARQPIAPADLALRLNDFKNTYLQSQLGSDAAGGVEKLSDEKRKTLENSMIAERIKAYELWGQNLSVYAGPGIFTLPAVVETVTPTPLDLWEWQVQYWTMYDVMAAVADSNASARDRGVTKSVVKRIERLAVDPVIPVQQGGAPIDPNAAPVPAADGAADYTKSVTGRKSGSLYDVVTANLTCVVATKDLPQFFDSLARTNLMTVTRVKMSKVDLAAELKDGYYYGLDGVTRVEMTIEALWLREWTKELMPKEVKVALGLEAADPNAAPGAAPGAVPPAGAPAPAGRRAGGSAGG